MESGVLRNTLLLRGEKHHTEATPLFQELPFPLAAPQAFSLFKDRPFPFFLDSGLDPARLGRYSFLGSDPFLILRNRGEETLLRWPDEPGKEERLQGNPFDILEERLGHYTLSPGPYPVPFIGGAVGYLSYDLCHHLERLPSRAQDDLQLPEAYLAFYDTILAFDHHEGRTYLVSTGFPEETATGQRRRAEERLSEMEARLSPSPPSETGVGDAAKEKATALRSNFRREDYLKAVEAAREYIAAGDIFQVNLSQRFQVETTLSPYELYSRLRRLNPAPFAAYLNFGEVAVVSASPERFLRLREGWAETRPIKGTRPRGQNEAQDAALAAELVQSRKDQSEHVMIVDLERNDLGRVCDFGTVRVKELMALEKYATVFHLTSTVVGRLRPGKTRADLLKACFPGGSITGAPKVRAMEIIDELEPTRRSVYTGAIGYLSFDGSLDLNIVIRTFLLKGRQAYFQVGGAVVYDSRPEAEYEETLDKARALFRALGLEEEIPR